MISRSHIWLCKPSVLFIAWMTILLSGFVLWKAIKGAECHPALLLLGIMIVLCPLPTVLLEEKKLKRFMQSDIFCVPGVLFSE